MSSPRPNWKRRITQLLTDAPGQRLTMRGILTGLGYPAVKSYEYPYSTLTTVLAGMARDGLLTTANGFRHLVAPLPPPRETRLTRIFALLDTMPGGMTFDELCRALDIQTQRQRNALCSHLAQIVKHGHLIRSHGLYGLPGTILRTTEVRRSKWPHRVLGAIRDSLPVGLSKRQVCIRVGSTKALMDTTSAEYRLISAALYALKKQGHILLHNGQYIPRLTPRDTAQSMPMLQSIHQ